MKRRLAMGDVHGRPFWKRFLDTEDFSAFYILGDYFDSHSFTMGFTRQLKNFTGLCAAARGDSRIKLCLGNHDYHYLKGVSGEQYSGYQFHNFEKIGRALEDNFDLLNIVYDSGDGRLLSHAGLSNHFMKSLGLAAPEELNAAFRRDRGILKFNGSDIYGDDVSQGPLWIRPGSLVKDPLDGYSQIVGHTPVDSISAIKVHGGAHTITLIDTGDNESVFRF